MINSGIYSSVGLISKLVLTSFLRNHQFLPPKFPHDPMPVTGNGFPGRIEPGRRDVMPRKRIPYLNPGNLSADNDLIKIVKQLIGTLIKEVGSLGKVAHHKGKLIGNIRIYLL